MSGLGSLYDGVGDVTSHADGEQSYALADGAEVARAEYVRARDVAGRLQPLQQQALRAPVLHVHDLGHHLEAADQRPSGRMHPVHDVHLAVVELAARVGKPALLSESCEPRHRRLCEATLVFLRYCSADRWTGTRGATRFAGDNRSYTFSGALILTAALRQLRSDGVLRRGAHVLFGGQSARGHVAIVGCPVLPR